MREFILGWIRPLYAQLLSRASMTSFMIHYALHPPLSSRSCMHLIHWQPRVVVCMPAALSPPASITPTVSFCIGSTNLWCIGSTTWVHVRTQQLRLVLVTCTKIKNAQAQCYNSASLYFPNAHTYTPMKIETLVFTNCVHTAVHIAGLVTSSLHTQRPARHGHKSQQVQVSVKWLWSGAVGPAEVEYSGDELNRRSG
jgi:hypothetical protein